MNYYDSKYDQNENDVFSQNDEDFFKKKESFVEIITIVSNEHNFRCKKCKVAFIFNNKLHQHLRSECKSITNAFKIIIKSFKSRKAFLKKIKSVIELFKNSSIIFTIMSFVNSDRDIKIEFDFRKYQYVSARLILRKNDAENTKCFDNDVVFILTNRRFFQTQSKKFIKKMITFIIVREIGTDKHFCDEYVIFIIFFRGTNAEKQKIRANFKRKIHIMNEFKTNILIKTNILTSKKFNLNFKNSTTMIENCRIIISITIKRRSNADVDRIVNLKKIIMISPRSILSMKIHHLDISTKRNFLFEFNDVDFFFYAHMIDSQTTIVMIRNEKNKSFRISRNFRLKKTIELNYSNAFQIFFEKMKELTIKFLKSMHKKN